MEVIEAILSVLGAIFAITAFVVVSYGVIQGAIDVAAWITNGGHGP